MSKHTQKLELFFDWILKSDLEGSSYFLDNILGENSISLSDKIDLISFLDAEKHMNFIISILESNNDTKLIEHLIKKVEFKIDRLESLAITDHRYFFPLLDEYKRIISTWENLQHYYDRLADVSIHLLNEGYQGLIDHYPAELTSKIADNLDDIFILNNDLSLEAYSAFIEQINPEPFNLTENIDWDKVHFLNGEGYLALSEETITLLFQQIDKEEKNQRLLIEIIETFDKNEIKESIKKWLVKVEANGDRFVRMDFIKTIFRISADINLLVAVFEHCLHSVKWNEASSFEKRIPIKRELLLEICKNLPNDNLRIRLLIEFFNTITEEDLKNIRAFFGVFEDEQFKKLERNTRTKPVIENSEMNQQLVELLIKGKIAKREKENSEAIFLANKVL